MYIVLVVVEQVVEKLIHTHHHQFGCLPAAVARYLAMRGQEHHDSSAHIDHALGRRTK